MIIESELSPSIISELLEIFHLKNIKLFLLCTQLHHRNSWVDHDLLALIINTYILSKHGDEIQCIHDFINFSFRFFSFFFIFLLQSEYFFILSSKVKYW